MKGNRKENENKRRVTLLSINMEPFDEGIEATDLASLLHRFEEAVTPPATPTPTQQVGATKSLLTVISKDSNSSASKTDVTASQLQVRPRAVYASNKPGITILPFSFTAHSRTISSAIQSPNIIRPQVATQNTNTFTKTAFQLVPTRQAGTSLLVRPASQTAVINQQVKQALASTTSKSTGRATSTISVSTATSIPVTAASTALSQPLHSLLLDKIKSNCIIPKRGAAKNLKQVATKVVSKPQLGAVATSRPTKPALSLLTGAPRIAGAEQSTNQLKSFRLSQSLPSSPTSLKSNSWSVKEAEHDYCSKVLQTSVHSQNPLNVNGNQELTSDNKFHSVKSENIKATVSDAEVRTISSLDAELLQDIEYLDEHFGPRSLLGDEITVEHVLEDGEVMVDEDGNDSFLQLVPSGNDQDQESSRNNIEILDNPEDMPHQNSVAFNLNGEESGRRRGRRYRRRTELNTSPIREDTTEFFDKIPAFYTALSIPQKPTKMSVFASATKSLGSTDHLAPDNISTEQVDMGLYDKVPAHRRCFTNTTKDLDLTTADPSEEQSQQPVASLSSCPMSSSLLSSSSTELNPDSSSPPRRARSRSRKKARRRHLSSCSGSSGPVSHLSSRSRSGSRPSKGHFQSHSRSRSCSVSSRSCSTCSSHSSGSSCGSSCSGCSRSRSRSCSTCCSSSSSRSRSRSPQVKRDWQIRGTRAGSSHRSRHHHNDRRSSRRSRSISPAERAGWRSRSRSQRKRSHSRSSLADEKAAERRKAREEKKIKDMEERRVVYVGKIPDDYTKRQLHQRFQCFGEIKEVKLNFREHGDNYGFVTFAYACDAIAAKEQGNNMEGAQKFDLCFGGRRLFCPDQYADLDGNREIEEEYAPVPKSMSEDLDYAALLKRHSSQQRKGHRL